MTSVCMYKQFKLQLMQIVADSTYENSLAAHQEAAVQQAPSDEKIDRRYSANNNQRPAATLSSSGKFVPHLVTVLLPL